MSLEIQTGAGILTIKTVEDKIEEIVKLLHSKPEFIGGSWGKANVLLDHIPLPAVIYVTPVSGDMHKAGQMVMNEPNVLLAFVDKIEQDSNFDEENRIRNRMLMLAVEFLQRATDSGYFYEVKDFHYTTLMDKADVNLCGIVIENQLKERQGVNTICLTK